MLLSDLIVYEKVKTPKIFILKQPYYAIEFAANISNQFYLK